MSANIIKIVLLVYLCSTIVTVYSIKQSQVQKYLSGSKVLCAISEFTCSNNKCISADKYCDNKEDCGDGSDEPRFCTKCNRTYHGSVGRTYNMELHRPKEDRMPYVCSITFTADGGKYGDIVQITLQNGFTLGKFSSYTQNGCKDGFFELAEASRLPIGGMFCGQSWGPSVFYSETRSLILTVKLFKLLREQNSYNFDFRIDYKFLSKEESVVRYGGLKSDIYENAFFREREMFQPSNDFDNKINPLNKKAKQAYDVYQEEFQSRINSWYENLNNPNTTATSTTLIASTSGKVPKKPKYKLFKNYTTEVKYYLGDLIPGTYCSRIYSNCDKKVCRLQSPNFPGTYPRNLTCYYAVRQHEVPTGKHALITVRQPKGNLVWIISGSQQTQKAKAPSTTEKEKSKPKLQVWEECDMVQDFIKVYDGYTTRDPVVLKFCGGGHPIPQVTSSGPELLVEFSTSPFGNLNNLLQENNPQAFNGFQLEVQVSYVDIQSPTYTKSKRSCEFWVRGTGHGVLENPRHSVPPNTTCLYHLQGTELTSRTMDQLQVSMRRVGTSQMVQSRFKIWLSVLKFDYAPISEQVDENLMLQPLKEDCTGMLRIFDGQLREAPMCKDLDCYVNEREMPQRLMRMGHNYTNVIARYCRGSIPRSCDHAVMNATYTRPCSLQESFITTSDYATLELKVTESTALRPVNFKINYEFVDLYQDGHPVENEPGCIRKFVSSNLDPQPEPIVFRSNRNIFLFGRSGAQNLNCVYRFEAQPGERVKIVVHRMMSGNRSCEAKMERDTERTYCYGNNSAKLQIFERPWHDSILFIRNCICNSTATTIFPITYTSNGRELEVHFSAINMTKYDDPDSLNFQATYEFIKPVTLFNVCKNPKRKLGSEGVISINEGDIECKSKPWLIEPTTGKYLYISFRGYYLSRYNPLFPLPINQSVVIEGQPVCPTKSRIIITTGESVTVTACPLSSDFSDRHLVEVFSAGWHPKPQFQHHEASPALSIEFLPDVNDVHDYYVTWLELQRRPPVAEGIEDCQFSCPELGACVNASIWCDGRVHCPSGYDESFIHCSRILRLPAEFLAVICVLLVVMCCACSIYIRRKINNHCVRSSVLQTRLKSLSSVNTDTATFDDKDFIS